MTAIDKRWINLDPNSPHGLTASDIKIDTNTSLSDHLQTINGSFLPISGGTLTGDLILSGDPQSDGQAATKRYIDSRLEGLASKTSVRVLADNQITLGGLPVVDGVQLAIGDRILVTAQTDGTTNGIYVVAFGSWSRATDANTSQEINKCYTFVSEGTKWQNTGWLLSTVSPTLGTTSLLFTQFNGLSAITAGDGLTKSGNTLTVVGSNRIVVNPDNIDLATLVQGSTGNLLKITLDDYGRVTGNTSVTTNDVLSLITTGSITNNMLANTAVTNLSGVNTGDQTITLTGDITGSGMTSFVTTLATVTTASTGTKVTYDEKGRVLSSTTLSSSDIPNLPQYLTGNQTITVTGDVTGSGSTSLSLTLANSGVTAGTYNNSATSVKPFTVDDKGRITTIGNDVTITPAWTSLTNLPAVISSVSNLAVNTTGLIKLSNGVASLDNSTYLTGNQTISITGDATGSGTTSISLTLSNSGVTAGTYPKLTVNAKGLVTGGTTLSAGDIPDLSATYQIKSANLTTLAGLSTSFTGLVKLANGIASLDSSTYLTAHPTITGASGAINNTGLTFLSGLTFDSFGHTVGSTSTVIRSATTSQTGVVQLSDSVSTVSSALAATSTAVKQAYDIGAAALPLSGGALTGMLTLFSDPTNALHAVSKQYVDSIVTGLVPKTNVRVATTTNITLSGTKTIDGISVVAGDRVLVKNQTNAPDNGIYVVASGSWTRVTDMDTWAEVPNAFTFVTAGTIYNNTGWLVASAPIGGALGTTSINWSQFSGIGTISAGTGITISGQQVSITPTTVTAGTYGAANQVPVFTVNAEGQLTAVTPTSISITSSAVSGLVASATTDTTNAGNISSGTLLAARLPAFTGDITSSVGTNTLTLANTGVVAGTYSKLTVNTKGLVTSATSLSAGDIPDLSATYQPKNDNLTSVAGLSTSSTGLVKFTNGVALLDTSSYLTGNQTVTISGDATGSGTTAITLTLVNSGVTAGTYTKVTVDSKGRATSGTTLLAADIPDLSATYQPKNANLTTVSGLSTTSTGLVKFINGVASLDSSAYLTGNQSITVSGDATGSGTTAITLTLANSGVTAGTYTKLTVDSKGRATVGTTLLASDIPDLSATYLLVANPVIPKTAGTGFKVDTTSPTYPWMDLIGNISQKPSGSTTPTLAPFRGGAIRRFFFIAGNQFDFDYHLPHDYVPNSNLFFHVHWGHNGAAISGNFVITVSMSWAKSFNQDIFSVEKTFTMTIPATNLTVAPRWGNLVSEVQISSATPTTTQFNSNIFEPDGELLINITISAIPTITGGTTNAPYIGHCDVHYQSTGIGTKQKSPNFYV